MSQEHKQNEIKRFKHLTSVKDGRLLVGWPSATDPIQQSKGFEISLVSYHKDWQALALYKSSDEPNRHVVDWYSQYIECDC